MSSDCFDITAYVGNIAANRSVKDALMAKLQTRRLPKRISVTDLLSLKQAYYRRNHPEIVPTLERQQLMWAGTGFHDVFGAAVSIEEYVEQFVEFEGVVGRIDIYETMPVESTRIKIWGIISPFISQFLINPNNDTMEYT